MTHGPLNRRVLAIATPVVLATVLAGCTQNSGSSGTSAASPGVVAVKATDTECAVSPTSAASGTLTFKITNGGSKVNEFYLLDSRGKKVVAEVENIGPGLARDLIVTAPAGHYVTACKPGMIGQGIRGDFTVTDSGGSPHG